MRSFARPSQVVSSAKQDRETGADAGDDERDDEDKSHEIVFMPAAQPPTGRHTVVTIAPSTIISNSPTSKYPCRS